MVEEAFIRGAIDPKGAGAIDLEFGGNEPGRHEIGTGRRADLILELRREIPRSLLELNPRAGGRWLRGHDLPGSHGRKTCRQQLRRTFNYARRRRPPPRIHFETAARCSDDRGVVEAGIAAPWPLPRGVAWVAGASFS